MASLAATAPHKQGKKKAAVQQVIERADSPAPSTASGQADGFESPYIKELQKNIRNINKKLTNASKTDSLIAEHAGKPLDQLVADKIINTDQRAQIQKKPALQAQLASLEEQLSQYLKVHEQYRSKSLSDKAELDSSVEQAKVEAVKAAKAEHEQKLNDTLLTLSQFLRLAALRREEAQDPESDESQAIEGVLTSVYSGDQTAVESILKLMEGSEESVVSAPGEQLQTTYSVVKALAQAQGSLTTEPVQSGESEIPQIGTDPTLANATATELEAGASELLNGSTPEVITNGITNIDATAGTGNAVAESHWDTNDGSVSQDWVDVKVPRDPAETDTGLEATPAAAANIQSWADDHPEAAASTPAVVPAAADPSDGFHQVQRNKSRNEGNGNFRGRGGRGGFRGRGHGGHGGSEGRGRGRGNRQGVASRPRRNNEES